MAEVVDIRELNERIERQSVFVTNLMTGMDQAIIGQIVDWSVVGWSCVAGRCAWIGKDEGYPYIGFAD